VKIVARGAEAVLYLGEHEGRKVLIKERVRKGYRISQLDEMIRKRRTREEAKLMMEARKVGVLTPQILEVDEKNHRIVMEFLEGKRLKDILNSIPLREAKKICREIGKCVGKLHRNGIIHGDLTTSNMIIKDGKLYFIDFGLGLFSRRIEDQGMDLCVLYESFRSTHFKILEACWKEIIKGYEQEYENAEKVLKRMEEIEIRARYRERKDEK